MMEQRFLELLERYKSNRLSAAERREWMRSVQDGEFSGLLSDELEKDFKSFPSDPDWTDKMHLDTLQQIRLQTGMQIKEPAEIRSIHRLRLIAAACILILASGLYLYFNRQPSAINRDLSAVNRQSSTDVNPGGNKATLTLSNGSTIILDSAHKGLIAEQTGANVMKSDSGTITYKQNSYPGSAGTILPYSHTTYNTLTTPRGGQYQLELPDGTKVWLDASSSITYPTAFTESERKVRITGEAYFEVKHNARQPFRVVAGEQLIEDIGTHFNINAYADEGYVKTTLLEGSVKVSIESAVNHQSSTVNQPSTILKPGQQAQAKNGTISLVKNADVEQALAWKNGKFIFSDKADIETIMRQIARWYDVDIEYRGQVTGHFWGSISRQVNVSRVLDILALTGNVHFKIDGRKIIVEP